MPKKNHAINYDDLFEIWADFDDADSKKEVKRPIKHHGLGQNDAMLFMAFCHGFEQATELSGRSAKERQ